MSDQDKKHRAVGFGIATSTTMADESTLSAHYVYVTIDPWIIKLTENALDSLESRNRPSALIPDDEDSQDAFSTLLRHMYEVDETAYTKVSEVLDTCKKLNAYHPHPSIEGAHRRFIITFIEDLNAKPTSTEDAYLRLHLMSRRVTLPTEINLEDIFVVLPNVLWTDLGPVDARCAQQFLDAMQLEGRRLVVLGLDKFPPMLQHVAPVGVRVADAGRVRLGAHLGNGTTVMHEGFVNMGAGTLGKAMIEGRISHRVMVGHGSDLGGGCSTMGTLSGGGKEVIKIGERCLIGANAGIGIALGNDCKVEAGLYVTAGMRLTFYEDGKPQPRTVKACELSGRDRMLYRRHSETGAIEAIEGKPDEATGITLNDALHQNTAPAQPGSKP